jgi:hypothetical protein
MLVGALGADLSRTHAALRFGGIPLYTRCGSRGACSVAAVAAAFVCSIAAVAAAFVPCNGLAGVREEGLAICFEWTLRIVVLLPLIRVKSKQNVNRRVWPPRVGAEV